MDIDAREAFDRASDEDIAGFVLAQVCRRFIGKDTDVIEVTLESTKILNDFNEEIKGAATRLFGVLEIIINELRGISGDGGRLRIESVKEGESGDSCGKISSIS